MPGIGWKSSLPVDREGRHRCWICKQEVKQGRTVIFKKIGFVEFICQTCYEKPNIQNILAGKSDVAQSQIDGQNLVKTENRNKGEKRQED